MRITPINNQRTNNNQAFGMAIRNINTYGMTVLEKQALLECLPELKNMYKDLDGDIELLQDFDKRRQLRVLTSNVQKKAIERIGEFVGGGIHWHASDNVGLSNMKAELLRNANASIAKFKSYSAKLDGEGKLDKDLKLAMLQKEVLEKGIYQPKSGPKNMTPPTAE
jgi:hypothetical protein